MNLSLVALEPRTTIDTVGALRARLGDALAAGAGVAIDLSSVTDIDLAGIQLLWAARRAAAAAGTRFEIAGPVPPAVQDSVRLSGLELLVPLASHRREG